MKCHSCGMEIAEGAKFCKFCGVRQDAPAEEIKEPAIAEEKAPVEERPAEPAIVEEPAPEQPVEKEPVIAEETPGIGEPDPVEEPAPEEPAPKAEEADPEVVPPTPPTPPVQVVQKVILQEVRPKCPALQLPTNRGMLKYFLLMLPTLCIYPAVILSKISTEINIVASRHDGRRTNHFLAMVLLTPLTLCIYLYVWYHKLCGRIGDELKRRKIDYKFGVGSYWLWNILWPCVTAVIGAIVCIVLYTALAEEGMVLVIAAGAALAITGSVGMFIFFHKFFKAMNLINAHFNENG